MKILNFGSLNIDHVYQVEKFVEAGETISSSRYNIFPGGKGLNQSIALARAGAEVYHAGMIGEDGCFLKEICNKNNVNTDFIRTISKPTGQALIQVDAKGENCIILYPGSNFCITTEFIDEVLEHFGKDDYLLLQNEINLIDYIIVKAHERGMKIILNPAPMDKKVFTYNLKYVDYLIVNETECFGLTGARELEKALMILEEEFKDITVILTRGSDGLIYKSNNKILRLNAYKVRAVDTTAAGDTFIGYFIAVLSQGKEVEIALEYATKASAITVSREGASVTIPTMEEVINFDETLNKR